MLNLRTVLTHREAAEPISIFATTEKSVFPGDGQGFRSRSTLVMERMPAGAALSMFSQKTLDQHVVMVLDRDRSEDTTDLYINFTE